MRKVALIVAALASLSAAQKTPMKTGDKRVRLVGRVLADVSSFAFGVGLGPEYTTFVFAAEQNRGTRVQPVKISYAFFKSEGPPPDTFFDYSKRYELQVVRNTKCDESVASLSHVENVDESGNPLPPSDTLRFLEGAPKDALKSDAILPCYVLRPGKYKVLSGKEGNMGHRGAESGKAAAAQ